MTVAGLSCEMGAGVVMALAGSCGDAGGELEAKTVVLRN